MSRRCCPRVEEGMAWGRGRWGCMAVNGEQRAEMMRRAVCGGEMAGESDQTGLLQQRSALCSSWQLAPLLITSYRKCRTPPFTSCLFSTVPCFSNNRWLIKRPCLPLLLCAPLHTDSPLIPESALRCHTVICSQNRRVPVASFQRVPAPQFLFGTVWQAIIPSSSVSALCGHFKMKTDTHIYIKTQTHKGRWMIYVFIYAIYFFSRYRCQPTFFPKNKTKKVLKQKHTKYKSTSVHTVRK